MRIRKKQHPILHGAAFLLTGGMSAPASAAMMGGKASRNRKADAEVEYLAAAMRGEQKPPAAPRPGKAKAGKVRFTSAEREYMRQHTAGRRTSD